MLNSNRLIKSLIWILLIFTWYACSSRRTIPNEDATTTGFVTPYCFQVLIIAAPDKAAIGLVAKRKSALLNAKLKTTEAVYSAISNYIISKKTIAKAQIAKEKQKIKKWCEKNLPKGQVAYEYYLKDKSAILVYRIFKNGLKATINTATY